MPRSSAQQWGSGSYGRPPKRRRGPNPWLIAGAIAAVLLVIAAFNFFLVKSQAKQQAACALIIDRTSSSADFEASFKHDAHLAITGCQQRNASLTVWYFDQKGSKAQLATSTPLALWGGGVNPRASDSAKASAVKAAQAAVAKAFADSPGGDRGSDIISVLNTAATSMSSDALTAGISSKYLIVLTDGIQKSSDVSVGFLTQPGAPVAPLVNNVRQDGLLPDLRGTVVDLIGVKSGKTLSGEQPTAAFEANVQRFWQALIAAGGGTLGSYQADETALPR